LAGAYPINFDHRDAGFAVHVLAEDAKTPISGWTKVVNESALLKLLAYYGCLDMEEQRKSLRQWGPRQRLVRAGPGLKDLLGIHR
jgi:hypothetical protein